MKFNLHGTSTKATGVDEVQPSWNLDQSYWGLDEVQPSWNLHQSYWGLDEVQMVLYKAADLFIM